MRDSNNDDVRNKRRYHRNHCKRWVLKHVTGKRCPFLNTECLVCQKPNHWARKCWTKKTNRGAITEFGISVCGRNTAPHCEWNETSSNWKAKIFRGIAYQHDSTVFYNRNTSHKQGEKLKMVTRESRKMGKQDKESRTNLCEYKKTSTQIKFPV